MTQGFRLSPQQTRLWALQQQSGAYQVRSAILLEGLLNKETLRGALEKIVARHTILRATFHRRPGMTTPLQVIHDDCEFIWTERNLAGLPPEAQEARITELLRPEQFQDFDHGKGPLLHSLLLALSDQRHVLILSLPAICADSRTARNIFEELGRWYAGETDESEEDPAQYIQFAEWENELIEDEGDDEGKRFWRSRDFAATSDFRLPFEEIRSGPHTSFNPEGYSWTLGEGILSSLESLAYQCDGEVEDVLLAGWEVLWWRLMGQMEFVIGARVDGRKFDELEPALGAFAKYVPLECRIDKGRSFIDVLQEVIDSKRDAGAWQEYFDWGAYPKQATESGTFFPIQFDFEEAPSSRAADGVWFSQFAQYSCIDRFKINLRCVRRGSLLSVEIQYDPNYVQAAAIGGVAESYETILRSILECAQTTVSDLKILGENCRRQLAQYSQGAAGEYPRSASLPRIFEEQAGRIPDSIAAVFEDQAISYAELNRKANQLAHCLIESGIGPGAIVALCLDRSLEMVIGLLGITKAGAAYLPIDPDIPKDRIEYQISETQAPVLITRESLLEVLPAFSGKLVLLSCDWSQFSGARSDNPTVEIPSEALVYAIYTSGSTGLPKGVAISHRNLLNYVYALCDRLRLFEACADFRLNFATVSTIAADLGNSAIFPSLIAGGCLHVLSAETATDAGRFEKYFSEHGIDVLKIVPSHLRALVAESEGVLPRRVLIMGGEALSFDFASQVAGSMRVINHYGPTETTIGSLTHDFSEHGDAPRMGPNVPIGRPIANTEIHILDQRMNPAPPGVCGELYIGGDGIAQYYINKPHQTAERFLPNPYSVGTRLYKTGDLARFLPDGNIEFLGRVDNQVKIHGYRIELGEIESVLSQHPGVREAVVIAREDEKDRKRLVAYFVGAHTAPASSDLFLFLKQKLPGYMIPSAFVALKAMPLTGNGKLDRHRLPVPGNPNTSHDSNSGFVDPRTRAEQELARIWKDVLRVERVGIHDNFFELGGDSILSLQIVARAGRAGIRLTHKQLFEHPTIAALAQSAGQDEAVEAQQGIVTGVVPLTPIQQWFFGRNLEDPHHWNLGTMLEVWPRCDAEVMKQAVQHLVVHHDALRLKYIREGAGWRQICEPPDNRDHFSYLDLSDVPDALQAAAIEHNAAELQASLDLSDGPLFRVILFDLGADKAARLLIIVHHLVIDGVSWRILLEDLQVAYDQLSKGEAVRFQPKTTSFLQWAEALSKHAQTPIVQGELVHWLKPRPPFADFKPERSKGVLSNLEASARSVVTSLDTEDTRALLQDVPAAYRTQINDVLLTALVQAFAGATGERCILIDLEGHGREPIGSDVDVSRTVGWFTTHFPVVLDLSWSSNIGDAIKIIKEQIRSIPRHGIGWGLLRYMSDDRETVERCSALPHPDVSFNYLGQFENGSSDSGFKPARESHGSDKSPRASRTHLLRINASVIGGRLQVNWSYSDDVHERPTIESLAGCFMDSLKAIIAHCLSPEAGGCTPSDFSESGLSQNDIDVVIAAFAGNEQPGTRKPENLEDMYSLSPLQEGMLYHRLAAAGPDSYSRQLSFEISGNFDVQAFEHAWQQVIDRHTALRTAFFWQGVDKPRQLVHKRAALDVTRLDWQEMARPERDTRLDDFLSADRERGFDLSRPPLMRVTLIRTARDSYRFVWTYHHLIMDAWSRASIYKEVLGLYEAHRQGLEASMSPACPYGEYVAWLRAQDHSAAETFWRAMLQGFAAPTRIGRSQIETGTEYENTMAAEEIRLPADLTSALRSFAQQQKLTLNTLVQGAWALLLSGLSGEQDVAFGTVVSGRPAELKGVESMVGALINTIVTRVQVPLSANLLSWLQEIQLLQVEMSQYEFSRLVDVQRCSDVPRGEPLFESVLNFANHPLFNSSASSNTALEIADVRFSEDNPYPLVVHVSPGSELSLRITYNSRRFDPELVADILARTQHLLQSFLENPERRLGDLMFLNQDLDLLSDEIQPQDENDADAQFVFSD